MSLTYSPKKKEIWETEKEREKRRKNSKQTFSPCKLVGWYVNFIKYYTVAPNFNSILKGPHVTSVNTNTNLLPTSLDLFVNHDFMFN